MSKTQGRARRLLRGIVVVAAALAPIAAPARATPFDATLSFSVFLGPIASGSASLFGSGSAGSAPAGFTLPAGLFAGSVAVPVVTPSGLTRISLTGLGNGMGSFASLPGGVAGKMRVYGYGFAVGSVGAGPVTLASVPLFVSHRVGSDAASDGVGVGGYTFRPNLEARFAPFGESSEFVIVPWGKNVYQYTYHFAAGAQASNFVNSTLAWTTVAGSDSRTPGGLGQLTLVSPTVVRTSLGAQGTFLVLASLTLNFVPEPGTLLLLGAGAAALCFLGRGRLRRR